VSNDAVYSQYRLVVTKTFGGTYARISQLDLFMLNANSDQLDLHETPVVLKNNILWNTRIASFSGVKQSVYRLADLSGNTLEHNPTNGGEYVNSVIYGLSSGVITTTCFDGEHLFVADSSGNVAYLSNDAANTHLNFDNSFNGISIDSGLSSIYAACWNRQFVLFGGDAGEITYGRLDRGATWLPTNAGQLFSRVYGIASNPGYGFVYVPNALYFQENDLLRVVGPKYNSNAGPASIRFNLNNSNIQ
jgi:hypothetical protein